MMTAAVPLESLAICEFFSNPCQAGCMAIHFQRHFPAKISCLELIFKELALKESIRVELEAVG